MNPFNKCVPFLQTVYGNRKGQLRTDLIFNQLVPELKKLNKRITIVDIGCGHAPITKKICDNFDVEKVYLMDSSRDILDVAEKNLETLSEIDIEYMVMDFYKSLEFIKNKKIDLIICHGLLNWLDEPILALDKFTKSVKQDQIVSLLLGNKYGYILENLKDGNLQEAEIVKNTSVTTSESYPDKKLYLFNPEDVEERIIYNGLSVIRKSGIRIIFDLLNSKEKHEIEYKRILELEESFSVEQNFWKLGDMVHFLFRKDKSVITDKSNNVFSGENAILSYLNPDNNIVTPLIELPEKFNKYKGEGVRIYAKLMNTLPLGNVKSLPALNMLLEKKQKGGLDHIDTIIENSSGNTVFSLSIISKLLGVKKTKAVVSHEVSPGKLNLLRFLDTEIIINQEPICPDPTDPESGIYKAKKWAIKNNWFNPGQYDNEANPNAHYKWTAPQIWQQTKGNIDVLVTTLGTTGTIYGIGKYLKEKNKDIKVIGIARALNNPIPGPRTKNLLNQITFDWRSYVDSIFEGDTVSSYKLSMQLSRSGILVGPSSGLSLLGVYKYLESLDKESRKDLNIVFVCPDSPLPYIEEYFEVLGQSEFPTIENKELLLKKNNEAKTIEVSKDDVEEIEPDELFSKYFFDKFINQNSFNKEILILDVRSNDKYIDHHIQGAVNVPLIELDNYIVKDHKFLQKFNEVVCVCNFGNSSKVASSKLSKNGFKSFSLVGGMAKWSDLDLPRVKPKGCIIK